MAHGTVRGAWSLERDFRFQKRVGQKNVCVLSYTRSPRGRYSVAGRPHNSTSPPMSGLGALTPQVCGCQGHRARRSSQPVSPQAPAGGEQPAEARAARRRCAAGARHDHPLPQHVSPVSLPGSSPTPWVGTALCILLPSSLGGDPPTPVMAAEGRAGKEAELGRV